MTLSASAMLWRRAAVLGSFWAASEIVLGSFLHNARVPLRGHFLTGVGIAILVAGHRLWPQRGLLWRAGLVCAAMKSISPSAVILGPMVAISAEGFLLELGVLFAGGNPVGYVLGGGLAMSWALFHKVGNILLFYGPETLRLYAAGVERLRVWSGLAAGGLWMPLALLWIGHFLGGGAAALVGWRAGRERLLPRPAGAAPRGAAPVLPAVAARVPSRRALFLHLLCVGALLGFGHRLPLSVCAAAAVLYGGLCAAAYPRARALARRSGLWAGVLGFALLAGLLLGRWDAGLRMALRAVLLALGFSCIGEELRDPRLVAWMRRQGAGPFFDALEQAFDALPEILAGLPPARELLSSPVHSLRTAFARAPVMLGRLGEARVLLLVGGHGKGKSSAVARLAEELRRAGRSVGGIHCPGFWEGGERAGFDVVDLRTGERRLLCRREGPRDWTALGRFRFSPEGFRFGLGALSEARAREADVLFVDEVGYLELEGLGWAEELDALVCGRGRPMVWVVRDYLVEDVRRRWGLPEAPSVPPEDARAEAILSLAAPSSSDA